MTAWANSCCRLIWLAVVLGGGLPAATPGSAAIPYNVRLWQTDDGLPQNPVFALAQTPDGYLWVGTRGGLARFNGIQFVSAELPGAPELKDGWITALCVTRDGALWIGCEGHGLVRWRDHAATRFTSEQGLPGNQPRCLLETQAGALWAGCEAGLAKLENGRFVALTQKDGLADDSVRALWENGDGRLSAATKRGLSTLRPEGGFENESYGANWLGNALRAVLRDHQGRLWVGATDGLSCTEAGQRQRLTAPDNLPDNIVNCLYEDRAGQLWAGTYGGLARLGPGPRFERLLDELVHTLFEDREGNLWVGTRDGLYRLNPARFTTYTTENGLSHNNVMAVCEDAPGNLWLGIWDGGLNQLRETNVASFSTPNRLARDSVLSLAPRAAGGLWLGLDFEAGLECFENGRRISLPRPAGLPGGPVLALREDRRGALWVGAAKGLGRIENGRVTNPAEALAGHSVEVILEGADGVIWAGSEIGLGRWRDGAFTLFTTRDGLSHDHVCALLEDHRGVLWIGTRGGGLNRLEHGQFTAFTPEQGLFSPEVYEILEDDQGCFWMSCRRGIFRVARRDLEAVAAGAAKSFACTVFGRADGLRSVQCNGVSKPAAWKGREGRLWFATIRGAVRVDTRIGGNDQPPPVWIERVSAAGVTWLDNLQTGPPAGPLRLRPGKGDLEIHYAGLSLQAPEKSRFEFMLEGVDLDWVKAGSDRSARYHRLGPGKYRFRVRACNNDGVWNQEGAALSLILPPHVWQTWWFRTGLLAAAGGGLLAFHRWRLTRWRELEHLRMRIAANLHDDVGSRLTKVVMISETVDQETPERDRLKPQTRALFKTAREIVQAVDEIVWTINPGNDTVDRFATYLFHYAEEYFQDTGVRCRIDVPAELPERTLPTELRHNLFMAIKEALANVLKHAQAAEVRLALHVTADRLRVEIEDRGRGFQPGRPAAKGHGLRNMKTRLESVGGRMELASAPGAGTTVVFEISAL